MKLAGGHDSPMPSQRMKASTGNFRQKLFAPQASTALELVGYEGEHMSRETPQDVFPDEDTLQAWENMRIEILHELQEGGSADVPDSDLDEIGTLVPLLASAKAHKKLRVRVVKRPKIILTKSKN